MPTEKGFVYLLKSDSGHWKIGKTSNPNDRLRTFSVKLPIEVAYEHLISCYHMGKLEKELHEVFADRRLNGEWFALDDIEVKWIKAITTQVHFDVLLTSPNIYMYRAQQMVEGEQIHKMERSLVFKGVLCLLLMFTLLIGVVAMDGVFMTYYVALPIILGSFTLLAIIGGDVVNIYTRIIRNIDKQSARVK